MDTPRLSPRLLLLLDFDSTLTTTCTLPSFLSIPQTVFTQLSSSSTSFSSSMSPKPPTASELSSSYLSDLEAHKARFPFSRRTLDDELTHQSNLRPVERASFLRGVDAFRCVKASRAQIHDAARRNSEVQMRKGWLRAIQHPDVSRACVLSVVWSPDWIRGMLEAAAVKASSDDDDVAARMKSIEDVKILCNDVLQPETMSPSEADGREEADVYVSSDKLRVMNELKAKMNNDDGRGVWTIYIGDSMTDLECLLAADVGIVIRDEGALGNEQRDLRDTLQRHDISTEWLGDFGQIQTAEGKVLWWATDFVEVLNSGCLDMEDKYFGDSPW